MTGMLVMMVLLALGPAHGAPPVRGSSKITGKKKLGTPLAKPPAKTLAKKPAPSPKPIPQKTKPVVTPTRVVGGTNKLKQGTVSRTAGSQKFVAGSKKVAAPPKKTLPRIPAKKAIFAASPKPVVTKKAPPRKVSGTGKIVADSGAKDSSNAGISLPDIANLFTGSTKIKETPQEPEPKETQAVSDAIATTAEAATEATKAIAVAVNVTTSDDVAIKSSRTGIKITRKQIGLAGAGLLGFSILTSGGGNKKGSSPKVATKAPPVPPAQSAKPAKPSTAVASTSKPAKTASTPPPKAAGPPPPKVTTAPAPKSAPGGKGDPPLRISNYNTPDVKTSPKVVTPPPKPAAAPKKAVASSSSDSDQVGKNLLIAAAGIGAANILLDQKPEVDIDDGKAVAVPSPPDGTKVSGGETYTPYTVKDVTVKEPEPQPGKIGGMLQGFVNRVKSTAGVATGQTESEAQSWIDNWKQARGKDGAEKPDPTPLAWTESGKAVADSVTSANLASASVKDNTPKAWTETGKEELLSKTTAALASAEKPKPASKSATTSELQKKQDRINEIQKEAAENAKKIDATKAAASAPPAPSVAETNEPPKSAQEEKKPGMLRRMWRAIRRRRSVEK
mmetsp:Transcript_25079/g.34953  ORF Transcript_25079/g.34953 Transcript_25079/m.34953 type:complete len:617 (-) Transcript_25079:557-2407(-)